MFALFMYAVAIFDGLMVGVVVATIISRILGDKPAARIVRVLLGIAAGGGYSYWCFSLLMSTSSELDTDFVLVVMFAPVALFFLLKLLNYAFKKE